MRFRRDFGGAPKKPIEKVCPHKTIERILPVNSGFMVSVSCTGIKFCIAGVLLLIICLITYTKEIYYAI